MYSSRQLLAMSCQAGIEHVVIVHFKLALGGTMLKIGAHIAILLLLSAVKRDMDIAILVAGGTKIYRDESEDPPCH